MERKREIPYNYTSADDAQVISHLFGTGMWDKIDRLRSQRVTGRSARLLMRFIGDMFILDRNPFVFEELIRSGSRRKRFFKKAHADLDTIDRGATNPDVIDVIIRCRAYATVLESEIKSTGKQRRALVKALGSVTRKENICFDPFALTAHATDATDWRLYLPFAVLRPDTESEVSPMLSVIETLGFHAIPRGGGTGLTGGAVPVGRKCIMINTEKLNRIRGISQKTFTADDGSQRVCPIIRLETGVITDAAMKYAAKNNLIFATDPTSSWAATIGGNIAENAGGKKAVLWGTCIDNIVSFKISMPGGKNHEVRRVDHRMRKIMPTDTVTFEVWEQDEGNESCVDTISMTGIDVRKEGLGKDITNKALNGVPGIQKEGTDGIITSAEFILYSAYPFEKTFCLEFFGPDMEEASEVIVAISRTFVNQGEEALMALEHFDDEYVRAIDYKVKSPLSETPKAVLLIDMVAHTETQIQRGIDRLKTLLAAYPNSYLFIAADKTEAQRFWRDRKRLGAIARRTNAFKLNEDIVLPLDQLAEFTRFVDAYNLSEDRHNQETFIRDVIAYLEVAEPIEDPQWMIAKVLKARDICLEPAAVEAADGTLVAGPRDPRIFNELLNLFRGYKRVQAEIRRIYEETRAHRIVIATHMHAGDGNVHVNIPVFSNDQEMLKRAHATADNVMTKAVELGGVVSGEHGIGITKMKYMNPVRVMELTEYRKKVDPDGVMNPNKLSDPLIPDRVFTPSFNLLELEARILQHSYLEELSNKISACVRCGKCKVDCCTFYPADNMFYHPRNKNLAIGALIEALLYDVQRFHSTRFKHLRHLEEIADHCTLCHKCYTPCPVDIDTAEVSLLERKILLNRKYKKTPLITQATLNYLGSQNALQNALFRKAAVEWGGHAQRLGARVTEAVPDVMGIKKQWPFTLLKAPLPKAPRGTLRDILPPCDANQALLLYPEADATKTVFYFPGCGSERLYSQVGKAAIYLLLKAGIQIILPPPFLCCGFPIKANAKTEAHASQTLKDSIIFTQIREMLRHLAFDACLISCGTCREALLEMEAEHIFDAPIQDISDYVLKNADASLSPENARAVLYHAPCHDSLTARAPVLLTDLGYTVTPTPYCCSEAGTLAVSRPDITGAMLTKKSEAVQIACTQQSEPVSTLLTNCPSCLQGLGRTVAGREITVRHIAEELAIGIGGNDWEAELPGLLISAEAINI